MKNARRSKYDRLYTQTLTCELAKGTREVMALEHAAEVVHQRREADQRDVRMATGLPKHETGIEHQQRYSRYRMGRSYDEAKRLMFEEDVRAMKTARPEWDADRCAQEVRDRGFYGREGYAWSVRVARETLAVAA